jgi:hypothetical protein
VGTLLSAGGISIKERRHPAECNKIEGTLEKRKKTRCWHLAEIAGALNEESSEF